LIQPGTHGFAVEWRLGPGCDQAADGMGRCATRLLYSRSTTPAMAWPKPMHIAAMP
jgi:hypothetical protein